MPLSHSRFARSFFALSAGLLLAGTASESAAQEPFTTGAVFEISGGETQESVDFSPPVPDGRIFVVEYANGRAQLDNPQASRFIVFAGGVQVQLAPTLVVNDFGRNEFNLSEKTTFFSNRGETLGINATRVGNTNPAQVSVRLFGYLLDESTDGKDKDK